MKHLLSIEELSAAEIDQILALALELKRNRAGAKPLAGQTWALIFSK